MATARRRGRKIEAAPTPRGRAAGPENPRRGQDEGGYYIHILDPGFEQEPWPGERRIGPIVSREAAIEQAASDLATGYTSRDTLIGIFTEAGSVKRLAKADHPPSVPADHKLIAGRADDIRQDLLKGHAQSLDDQRAALEQLLPPGVTADDVLKLAGRIP